MIKLKKNLAQKNRYGKIALVTGASSGIGYDIAKTLQENGFTVYGVSRRAKDPDALPFNWMHMDVCDADSVKAVVDEIEGREGSIDILVNAAGTGICGSVEESTEETTRLQMETNFFGVLRLITHVLPGMRERGKGLIINIGSVAGIFAIPFQSLYSSSKFALEGLTEALRIELAPYKNVNACLVEPGDVKTGFTAARVYVNKPEDSPYNRRYAKAVRQMEKDEENGLPPSSVTRLALIMIKRKKPPVRKVTGVQYKVLVFLKRLLPSRLVEWLLNLMYPGNKI